MSTDSRISARARASRKNGARSRGPKTPEGKVRAAQNALQHGMRAAKHVVLPDEDAAEFAALEAALVAELAPVGALQAVLARRVAVAAWRLARADRIEADLFAERRWGADAGPGLALIRDGNGTRSFETLLRYRSAAMAEFWRALKTLKALQAEQAQPVEHAAGAAFALAAPDSRPAARATVGHRARPDEPERAAGRRLEYVVAEPGAPGRALHEQAAPWLPNEPKAGPARHAPAAPASRTNRSRSRPSGRPLRPMARPRARLPCRRACRTSGRADRHPARRAVPLARRAPGAPSAGAPGRRSALFPGAGPVLLESTLPDTRRIRESSPDQSLPAGTVRIGARTRAGSCMRLPCGGEAVSEPAAICAPPRTG